MLPRILILDDESSICVSLSLALQPNYDVAWETDPRLGLARLQGESFDLVLLDMVIGEYDGLDLLEQIRSLDPWVAVIMMTAHGSIRSSVSAMKRGAFMYLTKPLDLEELQIHIQQALEFRALNDSVAYLNERLRAQSQAEQLVGVSPAMQGVLQMIEKFRNVDANVLIHGESGTGKSLVAQALHFQGKWKHFVSVNCSAMDERQLEEELFGYKSGVYPGSVGDQRGKLDYANQGTLYLDGIGDMPLSFQAKFLRVLQEKSFTPVGGREIHRFDTRVIAASNRDLRAMVEAGAFRRDLFYRLNTVEIDLPPLRERREDIPLLCAQFIQRSNTLGGRRTKLKGITAEARSCSTPMITREMFGNWPTPSNMRGSWRRMNGSGAGTCLTASPMGTRAANLASRKNCWKGKPCSSWNKWPSYPPSSATAASAKPWPRSWASANGDYGTSSRNMTWLEPFPSHPLLYPHERSLCYGTTNHPAPSVPADL